MGFEPIEMAMMTDTEWEPSYETYIAARRAAGADEGEDMSEHKWFDYKPGTRRMMLRGLIQRTICSDPLSDVPESDVTAW